MKCSRGLWFSGLSVLLGLCAGPAEAADACRLVEVRFSPAGHPATAEREAVGPQLAVWVEDKDGRFVDTLYVTAATGLLGLGNRPGRQEMKTDTRWPYGRRPMVLPIWAHRWVQKRGAPYPKVVMGGFCNVDKTKDPVGWKACGGDAHNSAAPSDDDNTIAYHGSASSAERYFCAPSRVTRQVKAGVVDAISCASGMATLCKGYLSAKGETSVYPPRADLEDRFFESTVDHPDIKRYRGLNDVAAVSGATPPLSRVLDPPVRWLVPRDLPDGEYKLLVEASLEADFNAFNQPTGPYAAVVEKYAQWDTGYQWNGQPSVLYEVPFRLAMGRVFTADRYVGYGDRLGANGAVRPPDSTISESGGSGADRLQLVSDGDGQWRVKVSNQACDGTCDAPARPTAAMGTSTGSTLTLKLKLPAGAPTGTTLQVRYREGSPVTEQNFNQSLSVPAVAAAGEEVTVPISGLLSKTRYYVAVRSAAPCGSASELVTLEGDTTQQSYAVLHGCFVATAAYGTPLAAEVGVLRRLRDEVLLPTPAGQLFVAGYYAMSPPLAGLIAEREGARSVSRALLSRVVEWAKIGVDGARR